MSKPKAKRFYEAVSTERDGDVFVVMLDGLKLKTPGKLTLTAPSQRIADFVAGEWDAQEEHIWPETMPVTRLLNVALELTPNNRPKLAAEARGYGSTDMLCHRDGPGALARHQAKHWDPLLTWAAARGITLRAEGSILALEQDADSLDKIAAYTSGLDDLSLTLFLHLTAVFGSVVLAMAVMDGHISGEEGYRLSRLDADWQARHWGEDEEAKDLAETLGAEVIALCKILDV